MCVCVCYGPNRPSSGGSEYQCGFNTQQPNYGAFMSVTSPEHTNVFCLFLFELICHGMNFFMCQFFTFFIHNPSLKQILAAFSLKGVTSLPRDSPAVHLNPVTTKIGLKEIIFFTRECLWFRHLNEVRRSQEEAYMKTSPLLV